MRPRRDLVGPGLVLLLFGLWPWVLTLLGRTLGMRTETAAVVAVVCAVLGLASAHVALAIGVIRLIRVRRTRHEPAAATDAPRKPEPDAGAAAVVGRAATLVTVITIWGPFGTASLQPFVGPGASDVWPEVAWAFAVTTVVALLLGIVMLVRGAVSDRTGRRSLPPARR